MIRKTLLGFAAAALFALAAAPPASAGGDHALAAWKRDASAIVSHLMRYPQTLGRSELPSAFNVVTATIDRNGNVLEAALSEQSGVHQFDRASDRLAQVIEKLPALPASFRGDRAIVQMHLIYARSHNAAAELARAIVRTEQLAQGEQTNLAGLPVISLLGGAR
ncbi:MAG: hypothetical protein ACE5ED_03570 [Rhodothalassiaceae bacterium]